MAGRYADVGVQTNEGLGLEALLRSVRATETLRSGKVGRSLLEVGYFANVIDIGHGLGLALSTDGVGSKVMVAQLLGRYDTLGIDCVAMNVNDVICVGAEPVSMLDYIGIEQAEPSVLEALGKGLQEGARQAGINIVGGEISQMKEMLRGARPGSGLDLVGMCVGLVPVDRVNTGSEVVPGDVLLGLASSGLHSNGFSLARQALFVTGGLEPGEHVAELGRGIGEELLEPTRIFVKPIRALIERGLPVRAMLHITGDGLFNITRIAAPVGFDIDSLPEPPPVFGLIQRLGRIEEAEMYRVFNMGIGFCVIVPETAAGDTQAILSQHAVPSFVLGRATADPRRRIALLEKKLIGEAGRFRSI